MFVGAICFTSSGGNGGWVVLVFPRLFLEKRVFFPIRDLHHKKKVYATYTKKNFRPKKNASYAKKRLRDLRQKTEIVEVPSIIIDALMSFLGMTKGVYWALPPRPDGAAPPAPSAPPTSPQCRDLDNPPRWKTHTPKPRQ